MGSPILLCGGYDVRRFLTGKSNGDESLTVTTEEDETAVFSGESLPGDAADEKDEEEWSGDNNPFRFYFVKQFPYDDPEIKAKIQEADTEIYHCNSDRIHISNCLKAKRAERLSVVASMENLISSLDSMNMETNEAKREQEVVTGEIYSLSDRLSEIKMETELLETQLACVLDQRDNAFERIKILRIQRDKGNAAFFQSRIVMTKAIELAASGNVRDLEELSNSEVEKFMTRWNKDKSFRDDYKKRISRSVNEQELRCDVVTETAREKEKEESDEDTIVYEKLGKEEEEEEEEVDEEALKEKEREEQLEKARLAMERKKKLHEKAAAKAAIRVKKEAEKKLKELEKRAKKKKRNLSSSSPDDVEDRTVTEAVVTEPEKERGVINGRSVFPKKTSFRYRYYGKGNEDVLKAIKRRKAYRLWFWIASAAALALPFALFLMFLYI